MRCANLKDLLAAAEGLLSDSERRELVAHLAQCSSCRALEKSVQELLRLSAAAVPSASLAVSSFCPDESELLDYVLQRLTGAGRTQVEAHLAGCRRCLWQAAAMIRTEPEALPAVAPEWRDAVRQAELLVGDPASVAKSVWWPMPGWGYALASAAAVLLVVVAFFWIQGTETAPPRGPEQARVPAGEPSPAPAPHSEEPRLLARQQPPRQPEIQVRKTSSPNQASLQVLWPQEGRQVAREELEIRWQPVPGAHLYHVALLNRSGDVVWEGEAPSDRLRVPDDVPLAAGERYFVWVTAHVQGDGTVRSPSVAFEIRAPAPH
jgi:anti-sigma factor RsiW